MVVASSLRTDARSIISTASVGTYRPLVAWALGVTESCHAMYPARYWQTGRAVDLAPAEAGGRSLESGRWLHFTRARIEITGPDLARPMRVTWHEIATVLATGRITGQLTRECYAALAARRAHDRGDAAWFAVEDCCYAAGLAVWAASRPTDQGKQLAPFQDLSS